MADAVVGPATAAAKLQELEALECQLTKTIDAVDAIHRQQVAAAENMTLVDEHVRANLALLRSPGTKVVKLDTFRRARQMLRENAVSLRTTRASILETKLKVCKAKMALENAQRERQQLQAELDNRGKLLRFRKPLKPRRRR